MVATALDIVSLNELKHELRISTSETDQDTMLAGHIRASVSYVAQSISAPLIDRTETLAIPQRPSERPAFLRASFIKELMAVRYWNEDGELRMPANASIALADLGRQQHVYRAYPGPRWPSTALGLEVWPPADGWPDILSGACMEFDVKRGVEIDGDTEGLAQAVILCCRQLYDGYAEIKPNAAFKILINPWRAVAPA